MGTFKPNAAPSYDVSDKNSEKEGTTNDELNQVLNESRVRDSSVLENKGRRNDDPVVRGEKSNQNKGGFDGGSTYKPQ